MSMSIKTQVKIIEAFKEAKAEDELQIKICLRGVLHTGKSILWRNPFNQQEFYNNDTSNIWLLV